MDGAYRCPKGFWSAGLSARRCAICNSGMTTAREGAVSPTECEAEPGHYFLHGRAPPCARGTYKEEIGNVDCSICPDGFTTPPHTSAAITRATCNCEQTFLRPEEQQGPLAACGVRPQLIPGTPLPPLPPSQVPRPQGLRAHPCRPPPSSPPPHSQT
jgi:hypothetical protein